MCGNRNDIEQPKITEKIQQLFSDIVLLVTLIKQCGIGKKIEKQAEGTEQMPEIS